MSKVKIAKTRIKITIEKDGTEFHQAQFKGDWFNWFDFEPDGRAAERAHGLYYRGDSHKTMGTMDYAQKEILAYIELRDERQKLMEDEEARAKKTRYVIFP